MPTPRLRLYNTLTRTKEDFVPIDADNVRMYVCGPTVYDYAHIGNARPVIVFDVLYRLLRHLYGEKHVAYVRNITDVDDKINARAAERGISIRELTEETNRIFQADVKALGCLEPTVQPRATEHIAEMIAIIERLIAGGHAYAADGHVLFSVPSMPDYGRLSRRPLDDGSARQHEGAEHRGAQLTDVARPVHGLKLRLGILGQVAPRQALRLVQQFDEMPRQGRDILAPFFQRGNLDRHHVQPVVKLLPEAPGADLRAQVAGGR